MRFIVTILENGMSQCIVGSGWGMEGRDFRVTLHTTLSSISPTQTCTHTHTDMHTHRHTDTHSSHSHTHSSHSHTLTHTVVTHIRESTRVPLGGNCNRNIYYYNFMCTVADLILSKGIHRISRSTL